MSIRREILDFPRQTAIAEVFNFLPPVKKFVRKKSYSFNIRKLAHGLGWNLKSFHGGFKLRTEPSP